MEWPTKTMSSRSSCATIACRSAAYRSTVNDSGPIDAGKDGVATPR